MRAVAPEPTATIAMTAATPMMIPSIVSAERILFAFRASKAIRTVASSFILESRSTAASSCRNSNCGAASRLARTGFGSHPDDDLLPFFQVAGDDFAHPAVRNSERDLDWLRFSVISHHPHRLAPSRLTARPRVLLVRHWRAVGWPET